MAFLFISKNIVPKGKTSYIRSGAVDLIAQQAAEDGHIIGQIRHGYIASDPTNDIQPPSTGTIIQGTIWSNEAACNTYMATPAVQTDNAARDAYNTQHGITRTVQTLTI